MNQLESSLSPGLATFDQDLPVRRLESPTQERTTMNRPMSLDSQIQADPQFVNGIILAIDEAIHNSSTLPTRLNEESYGTDYKQQLVKAQPKTSPLRLSAKPKRFIDEYGKRGGKPPVCTKAPTNRVSKLTSIDSCARSVQLDTQTIKAFYNHWYLSGLSSICLSFFSNKPLSRPEVNFLTGARIRTIDSVPDTVCSPLPPISLSTITKIAIPLYQFTQNPLERTPHNERSPRKNMDLSPQVVQFQDSAFLSPFIKIELSLLVRGAELDPTKNQLNLHLILVLVLPSSLHFLSHVVGKGVWT